MEGTPQLVAKLLYGSGLQSMKAVWLRVKDIDFAMTQLTVRSGKGDKDRFTTFPATLITFLQNHLARVTTLHQQDLHMAIGPTTLLMRWNGNIGRQRRNGSGSTSSRTVAVDSRSGATRRHHVDPSVINKAIKVGCAVQG
jgi:hypothetical protein